MDVAVDVKAAKAQELRSSESLGDCPMLGLCCVVCRSYDLAVGEQHYCCSMCGTEFPVIGDVPVMFDNVKLSMGSRPDIQAARQVLDAFDLPEDAIGVERLRRLFSLKVDFGSQLIKVEAAQFLDRMRNSGYSVDRAASPSEGDSKEEEHNSTSAIAHWLLSYIPRILPPGEELLGNIRLKNAGTLPMRHEGNGRITLATRWYNADGENLKAADLRTPLPLDLMPEQALTLPVRFITPHVEGDYMLSVVLVEEGVRWAEDEALFLALKIRRALPPPAARPWTLLTEEFDYDEDHRRGVAMLRDWVQDYAPENPRLLEVGGNAIPMIETLIGELHNVDVDLLGLQVCSMRQRRARRSMTILCADAGNLPYQAAFFDGIVIFASLHHFPDPAGLLASLKSRVKPTGFIAVLCEPVGHIWPGAVLPEYLAELERGVNEQSFTTEEYAQIFRAAELEVAEAVVDKNSLKARLVPKGFGR